MQSTLRQVPQRKTFYASGPLQSKWLAKEFQERVREELIIAHSGELRAKKGSHGPSCLKLTNYK